MKCSITDSRRGLRGGGFEILRVEFSSPLLALDSLFRAPGLVILRRQSVVFVARARAGDDTFELGGQALVEREALRVVGVSVVDITDLVNSTPRYI